MALLVIAVVAVLVAATVTVLLVTRDDDSSSDTPIDAVKGATMIKSFDGVMLEAVVTSPSGGGRHPLVIMPSSYNANAAEYATLAGLLTKSGYVTISYTQRGFFKSGGSIDLAGADTQHDARSVIDWALKHTATDPKRIGMLGVSYGAGISLLTAANDSRVRAVVALSTWTDLAEAFRPHDTLSVPGLGGLLSNNRADSAMRTLLAQLQANPLGNGCKFVDFAKSRSPVSYLAGLNRNRPAIMLANGWQDSLFPPTMLVDFFGKLSTPKRLQMSIGDHVGPERDLLSAKQSRLGDAALGWLGHYLDGKDNGIDKQAPVQLEDVTTKTLQTYPSWPRGSVLATSFAAPSTSAVTIGTSPSAWTATLPVGVDSDAKAGQSQFVPGDQYRFPTTRITSLPADRALVWAAGPVPKATRVVGTPTLSLSVASSAPNASLFAYLYDTAPGGTGKLMTSTPLTVTGTSATAKPVSVNLEPTDWTLAPGHQLAVVVDTEEFRWSQAAPAGSTITVSSDAAHPTGLRVPTG